MLTHNAYKFRVVVVLLIAACSWFLVAYLDKTVHTKLYFDSGWHATVAKNLAFGHGYASSYNGYRFFDPDVTTGPVPITLASIAITFFGNTYSLPIYLASLLHLMLAIAVVVGVCNMAGRRSAIVLGLSMALIASYFEPRWWHIFTGDMSSMLWGILGLQLVVTGVQSNRNRVILAAGLVLGLAVLSKAVAIITFAGAGAYVIVAKFRGSTSLARNLLSLLLGLAISLSPWELYKTISEAGSAPAEVAAAKDIPRPLERNVVGVVQLWQAPDKLAHTKKSVAISDKLFAQTLGNYGLPRYTYLLSFLVSLSLLVYAIFRLDERRNHLLMALGLTTAGFWVWHILLCMSLETKYTFYPLFMSLILILYWLSSNRFYWLAPAAVLLWIMLGSASPREDFYRFYGFGYEDELYVQNLKAVAGELTRSDRYSSRAPLAACGWLTMPWPLEYILPGSDNFIDCYQRIKQAMVRDTRSGDYRWRDDIDLGFTLVVEKMLWAIDTLNADKNKAMLDICNKNPLYDNSDFSIVECRDADIRAKIVPAADSPFFHQRRLGEAPKRKADRHQRRVPESGF